MYMYALRWAHLWWHWHALTTIPRAIPEIWIESTSMTPQSALHYFFFVFWRKADLRAAFFQKADFDFQKADFDVQKAV